METTNTTFKLLLHDIEHGAVRPSDVRDIILECNEFTASLRDEDLKCLEEFILQREEQEFEEDTLWLDRLDEQEIEPQLEPVRWGGFLVDEF